MRWTLAVLACLLVALVYGFGTARADLSLGPHEARYAVTFDDTVVVDLGPLGTLEIDSPLPWVLGVDIEVKEIPADLQAVQSSLAGLEEDLAAYVQFFAGPQTTVAEVAEQLIANAALRFGGAVLVLAVVGGLGYVLLGRARRDELAGRLAPRTGQLVGGVLVAVLVVTSSTSARPRTPVGVPASAVFADTPLEGARITGRLSGIIDTYGAQVLDVYRDNERFYDDAERAVRVAWAERAAQEERAATLLAAATAPRAGDMGGQVDGGESGPADDGAPEDAGTPEGDAAPDGAAAPTPPAPEPVSDPSPPATPSTTPSTDPTNDPSTEATPTDSGERLAGVGEAVPEDADGQAVEADLVPLLVVSDLHCNVGMARAITAVAELSRAQVILDAGDTTMNGTSVERFCVSAFADAAPRGVPYVISTGNHDSAETGAQARAAGMTVLDGEVVEVAGVRILGDADPNETRPGQATRATGEETPQEAGVRLADVACAADVDLLLIHTPYVGSTTLDRGCAPVQVSGHLHRRVGPVQHGLGMRYGSASTAGAVEGELTIGPLRGVAQMTVLRFDPEARRMVDLRVVTLAPSGAVEVGAAVRFPRPVLVVTVEGADEIE
ncbi:hypothetical protein GCM10011331_13720 [Flavimobilis marinus]|nr:hypothetical protein GCM10011331_13720 [Flavimobilis marinus]